MFPMTALTYVDLDMPLSSLVVHITNDFGSYPSNRNVGTTLNKRKYLIHSYLHTANLSAQAQIQ